MHALIYCAVLSLTPTERDSILAETQGNEQFWLEILGSTDGEILKEIEYLLETIPRLDRLEMTEAALMDHVLGAIDSRDIFYENLSDSLFRQCLVQYRIDEEPVTPYRSSLCSFWATRLAPEGAAVYATAEEITSWIDSNMEVHDYDYLGGIGDPVSVLHAGGGTLRELRILLCASLKSLGIASRPVQGWFSGREGGSRRWIEIWDGSEWIPLASASDSIPEDWEGLALALVPTDEIFVTASYVPTVLLTTQPIPDAQGEEWTATLSIPIEGMLMPLDWIWFDTTEPDTIRVGPGPYILMVSFRRPSGAVDLWLDEFTVLPGDTLLLELSRALYSIVPLPTGGDS
jgi:hypothetical protein